MALSDKDTEWASRPGVTSPGVDYTIEKTGSLEYVAQQGENGSVPTYQEVSGAPVEVRSPLGYRVEWFTIIFLNIGQMVGTGVFSTPANILNRTGSVGLAMIYWVLGFIIGCCGLATFLELASYFPARSGSEVVFLEQAYPRPKWFFPTAFAVQSVILSFSSSNAIVMARYIFRMTTISPSPWQLKGVAVGCYSLAIVVVILNNRAAIWASNGIGIIKVLTLVFISITGFVVLGGGTRVENPTANFKDPFAGTTSNGFNFANALVNITFSYQGYENAFNVMGEVKNPIRTIKRSAPLSLLLVAVLYILCNVAYFAAIPKAVIAANDQVTASLFFSAVFGVNAARGLNFLITLSAFGNLISVLIGQSRVIREIGRQGVLPWPKFWVTTRPFGTPIGPYLLKWAMTILMIVAPPAGDAFNFVVDLANYPNSFFLFLMAVGVYLIRRQRKRANAPKSEFRAWDAAIILFIASKLFLLVMPWYPPAGGIYGGSVSFFYATSSITGIAIIVACAIYYYVWVHVIPKARGYRMRQTVLEFEDGAVSHSLVKVKVEDLDEWDATHDPSGKLVAPGFLEESSRSDDDEIKV